MTRDEAAMRGAMTPDDLSAARALVDAAQQPPWRVVDGDVLAPDDIECPRGFNPTNYVVKEPQANDAAFIAASRTLVPALLDEIQRLTQELAVARSVSTESGVPLWLVFAIRILHDHVDLTDPTCPVGVAITNAGLGRRP